jgi:NitT/TauT family transport system ATP-binding protein
VSGIVFEKVTRSFRHAEDTVVALDAFDLEVHDKEFLAIVGPSGCGKTTCLRLAAGLDFPDTGSVRVNDEEVAGPTADRTVVFQQFALFPWKTVWQNVEFGLMCNGVATMERTRRIHAALGTMGLTGYEKAFPHQLSGGMQQRVAIARAYVLNPSVLLMDEPFGSLDAQTRTLMQEELVRLGRDNRRTVLFITHAVEEALYLADRVVVMTRRPGRIREIIDVAGIRASENWERLEHVEDVMDLESFVHLRTRIWRLLREQQGSPQGGRLI